MGSNLLPAQQGRLARPDVPRLSGAHFALKFRLCDEIYENSTAFSAARVLMAFGWALLLNNAHGCHADFEVAQSCLCSHTGHMYRGPDTNILSSLKDELIDHDGLNGRLQSLRLSPVLNSRAKQYNPSEFCKRRRKIHYVHPASKGL